LTPTQEFELVCGFPPSRGKTGFETREKWEEAWWENRARLLAECSLFQRPYAFWSIEAEYVPMCAINGRELQEDALARLSLLTTQEAKLLAKQPPHFFPDEIPIDAIDHWKRRLRSIESRRDWHQREGRQEQAQHWREQGELLQARIQEAKRRK